MSDNGDSINKRIAIALGYRVVEPDNLKILSDSKWHYWLLDPDGNNIIPNGGYSTSEDKAWSNAPDWQHDLKLALGLFEGDTSFRLVAAPVPHGELLNWQIRARKKIYGEYVGSGDQVWTVQSLNEISERLCLLWLFLNEPQTNPS